MRRVRPYLIAAAIVAAAPLLVLLLSRTISQPPHVRPSQQQSLTFSEIASNFTRSPDPAAADRVRSIDQALSEGKLGPEDVDGILLSAFIMPARWLKEEGILKSTSRYLGDADQNYEIQLLHMNEPQRKLIPDIRTATELEGGLWHYSVTAYVDAEWKPRDPSSHRDRKNIPTLDEKTVHRLFDQLKQLEPTLEILESPPDLSGQQPATAPAPAPWISALTRPTPSSSGRTYTGTQFGSSRSEWAALHRPPSYRYSQRLCATLARRV